MLRPQREGRQVTIGQRLCKTQRDGVDYGGTECDIKMSPDYFCHMNSLMMMTMMMRSVLTCGKVCCGEVVDLPPVSVVSCHQVFLCPTQVDLTVLTGTECFVKCPFL